MEQDGDLVQECLGEDADPGDDTKPVRSLEHFVITNHGALSDLSLMEMLEADATAEPEALGFVCSTDLRDLDGEEAAVEVESEFYPLKLSSILSMWFDAWDPQG